VASQDIADRLIADLIPQIGQRPRNPVITPVTVLLGHANDQLLNLPLDPRPAGASTGLRAIEFAGHDSVDLRTLLRAGEGRVPVNCLLGVLTLKDGIGVLSPLRLDSQEATLAGAGSIDFAGQRLDLKLQSDHDTTGFFALDVPIAISGPFKRLAVTPLPGADGHWLDAPDGNAAVEALPASLHKLVNGSACAR
jgi:hypothetical protein